MATNFVQNGNVLTLTAPEDVVSGQVIKVMGMVVVVLVSALSGEETEVSVTGVFTVSKKAADTPNAFQKAYWDDTAKEFTTTATANQLVGCFTQAYAAATTEVNVRFNGVSAQCPFIGNQ